MTKRKKKQTEKNTFTFGKGLWHNAYQLYGENGEEEFRKDMQALIDNGFIEIVENGETINDKTIYTLSDKWRQNN